MGEETDIGIVFIINKFKVKKTNQPFRCIMIYQDVETEFCFIKPLLYKIDLEIVMELFRIFTSFGPPKVVHINSCSQETITSIDSNMKMLTPFKIEFVKSNTVNTNTPMLVVTKLHEWMKKTNREQWEIGCCVVQRQINTELAPGKEKSPHDLFFRQQEDNNESDLNSSDSEIEQTVEEAETLEHDATSEENEPLEQEETLEEDATLEQDETFEQEETLEQQQTLDQDEILEQEYINIPVTYEQVPAAVLSDHTLEKNTNNIKIKEELIETDGIETLGLNLGSFVHLFDEGISIRNLGNIIDIKEEIDDTE